MDCPDCGSETAAFAVPEDLREYVPGGEETLALCTHCLALHPAEEPSDSPAFDHVSEAFPTNPDAAIPMALVVGLSSSLALYRSELTELLGHVERAGVDPFLVLGRLADDSGIDATVDLRRRRHQLEQLLD
ncbi:DUF6276 family protein [Haloarculaceae archaeon H-GB1-1]|nr:DUF6276 family protein [Haloarculaceae archaeon H-GB1-1]